MMYIAKCDCCGKTIESVEDLRWLRLDKPYEDCETFEEILKVDMCKKCYLKIKSKINEEMSL